MNVKIIGGGLAGCEAAYQLAKRGINVALYERKGVSRHPAFQSDLLAELVCSNSLRSDSLENAVGLLKAEMRALDSLIMRSADQNRIPSGSSLAVDREGFSQTITDIILQDPHIRVIREEVEHIDQNEPTIIAAGPLCEGTLATAIKTLCPGDEQLYFYDAVAPIIEKDSIDFTSAYYKSRWDDEHPGDYINCPLTKEEFMAFYDAVIHAECAKTHLEEEEQYFEGCMPFEVMAKRGFQTLLFGPMKPVGLAHDGIRPYAVVQLRKDNASDTLYNIVGFQTHLTFPEQKRVLQLVPALKNCRIVRYGVMHRNTYINSPRFLNAHYQMREYPNIFFAGQISGTEGYVESAAGGLYAALSMYQYLLNEPIYDLPASTMMGAMAHYISDERIAKLVPMNANFGIFQADQPYDKKHKKAVFQTCSQAGIAKYREHLACLKKN